MEYIREPLLKPEVEEQLKAEMVKLWNAKDENEKWKHSGKEIAVKLKFGVTGTPYAEVRPDYVFYFRHKFNTKEKNSDGKKNKFFGLFPRRREPAFDKLDPDKRNHRYTVEPEEIVEKYDGYITPIEFINLINEKLSYDSEYCRRARSFNIMLYNCPLRSSEVYERIITDFKITKTELKIHLLRKKKHKHKETDEPITIPRNKVSPLIEEVITYLKGEEWKTKLTDEEGRELTDESGKTLYNLRPWDISHDTARNYAKELGEEFYSHFFRFRWISDRANRPKTTIDQLRAKTQLTLAALNEYIVTTEKTARQLDEQTLQDMQEKGEI